MKDYGVRKFIIAAATILAVVWLALVQKMTPEVATVFTVVNVAFHGANALIKRNGNG